LQLIVSTTGIEDEIEGTVTSYKLYDAYPNPFNPTTSIKYELGSSQFVSLKVYDVLGNEIATLVNEEKATGIYEVRFNVSNDLTSGVYFYRLEAGSYSETKKMLLMK
ncbi:MAG: T9SS type A sorting domain-containing protein, partial [Ignavibacterium sp.]